MACETFHFTVGSRDKIRLRFVDELTNAATGKRTLTAIDLTSATGIKALCKFTPDNGSAPSTLAKTLTKDADQVNNRGYADATWGASELIDGKLEVDGEYADGAGLVHKSPESSRLAFRVGTALI